MSLENLSKLINYVVIKTAIKLVFTSFIAIYAYDCKNYNTQKMQIFGFFWKMYYEIKLSISLALIL